MITPSSSKVASRFLFTISIIAIAFPIHGKLAGSPFIIPQIAFIVFLPLLLLERRKPLEIALAITFIAILTYTTVYHESPTFGFLYILSAILLGRKARFKYKTLKQFGTLTLFIFYISIAIGFLNGNDRVCFTGGDPNFTAFALSLALPLTASHPSIRSKTLHIITYGLIIFTFSRSGFLFLCSLSTYNLASYLWKSLKNVNEGALFLITQLTSIALSYVLMRYLFGDEMPEYVYREGFEKYDTSSIVDISNFIRLKANLFFTEENFKDIAILGAPSNNMVAYEYGDKFIRPHHFYASMVFEFGIIATILMITSTHRKSYWKNKSIIISTCVFGATLGFSYYYGFVILFLLTLANSTKRSSKGKQPTNVQTA